MRKNQKISSIVIAVVVLVVAIYVLLIHQPQPAIAPTIPTPSNTIQGNIYRNDTYGFEIQLPVGWTKVSADGGIVSFASPKDSADQIAKYGGEFNIFFNQNPNSLSLENFYNGQNGFDIKTDVAGGVKDIIAGGIPAKRLYDVTGERTAQVVIIPLRNIFVEFNDVSGEHILDSVISTFRLIK